MKVNDPVTYVPITEEQIFALRAVARAATVIAANPNHHDAVLALNALPHLLDDLALADSHAERAADVGGHPRVTFEDRGPSIRVNVEGFVSGEVARRQAVEVLAQEVSRG